jgi:acetyl esterase/lipase
MQPSFDQAYGTHPRHRLDVYPAGSNHTVIIFWHGGSWKSGSKEAYRFIGRRLASMGYATVLPNYRLHPEVRFPAFVEDGALAMRWVQNHLKPQRVILMGHSAGALIAADLALDNSFLKVAGVELGLVRGMVGLGGPYDFTPRPDLQDVFAGSPPELWEPIKLVRDPVCPILLIHGRLDPIVNYKNALSLVDKVKRQGGSSRGVIYPHLEHMLVIAPFLPGLGWVAPVRRQIDQFIKTLPTH